MSRLGKIILEENKKNPRVIISEEGKFLGAIELVNATEGSSYLKIPQKDILKLNYFGKKLNDCSASLSRSVNIYNLNIREIGVLSELGYCKLLRQFSSYQASFGGNDSSYLLVRNEVHKQLVKMMDRGIYGV